MEQDDLKLIFTAIESGKCLAFLGAGACMTYRTIDKEEPGLPSGKELAKWLAEKCKYTNGSIYDLQKISEYFVYINNGDREPLENAIKEKIQIDCKPRPIHSALSQLTQIKFVITSNYDDLLEQELRKYQRNIIPHIHNSQDPHNAKFEGPLFLNEKDIVLYKMHGCISKPETIIITHSDYIHYLSILTHSERGMPDYFRKRLLTKCTLLFLGYSLNDWNFQVIWDGIIWSNENSRHLLRDAYALVKHPSHFDIRYWTKRNVFVLNQDLTEFAIKLAEYFNLEIPQLEIKKRMGGT